MMKLFRRRPKKMQSDLPAGEKAGRHFDGGMNCAQSVILAVTGRDDAELLRVADAFGGGIGNRKCLCGAVTGGVIALGLLGREREAGKLVDAFREANRVTCCSALSRPYKWNSPEHRSNCRRMTAETADWVEAIVQS